MYDLLYRVVARHADAVMGAPPLPPQDEDRIQALRQWAGVLVTDYETLTHGLKHDAPSWFALSKRWMELAKNAIRDLSRELQAAREERDAMWSALDCVEAGDHEGSVNHGFTDSVNLKGVVPENCTCAVVSVHRNPTCPAHGDPPLEEALR
jgi:hypothetical protein